MDARGYHTSNQADAKSNQYTAQPQFSYQSTAAQQMPSAPPYGYQSSATTSYAQNPNIMFPQSSHHGHRAHHEYTSSNHHEHHEIPCCIIL